MLLDGYSKREWVTDEDEWEWDCPPAVGLPGGGARPVEAVLGTALFRDVLSRLTNSAATCEGAAKGELPPAPPSKGKRAASGAPKGVADGTAAAPNPAPVDERGAAPPEKKPRKRPAPKTAPIAEGKGAVESALQANDEIGDLSQIPFTKQANDEIGDLSQAPSGTCAKPPGGGEASSRKRKVEAEDAPAPAPAAGGRKRAAAEAVEAATAAAAPTAVATSR